jgi:hypothetical protein
MYSSETTNPNTWKIPKYNSPKPNLVTAAFTLSGAAPPSPNFPATKS